MKAANRFAKNDGFVYTLWMNEHVNKYLSSSKVAALLFFIVIVCYSNSLQNGFVWDDNTIIVRNDAIKEISNVSGIVFAEDTTEDMEHTGYYRPLTYLSYAIDYHLWGLKPAGFRAVNIFFHFISALILFHLAMLLFSDRLVSFFAAALFAAHPVHVESVTFIAARGSELSGFYYLLAFYFFVKFRSADPHGVVTGGLRGAYNKYKYLIFSSAAFITSFMAKEYAITLFLVMFAYDIAYLDRTKRIGMRSVLLSYVPYGLLTVCYFVARRIATGGSHSVASVADGIFGGGLLLRMVDAIRVVMRSIWTLIFPNALSVEYGFTPTDALLSINLLVATVVFALIIYYMYRQFMRNRALFVAIMLFLAPLTLTMGIIPLKGEAHLADRWLYISTAGFMLLIAYHMLSFINRVSVRNQKVLVVCLLFVAVLFSSYKTIERNRVFRDELSLWSDTVKKAPDSYKAHLNYGFALYKAGHHSRALSEYERALILNPDSVKAQYNIAVYHQNRGEYELAEREYEDILSHGYSFFDLYFNLAECYEGSGDSVDALINYKKALLETPNSLKTLTRLALIYYEQEDNASAMKYIELYESIKSSG